MFSNLLKFSLILRELNIIMSIRAILNDFNSKEKEGKNAAEGIPDYRLVLKRS